MVFFWQSVLLCHKQIQILKNAANEMRHNSKIYCAIFR